MTDKEIKLSVENCYEALLHRAWTLLHNGEDARDVVQQAVLEFWERRSSSYNVEIISGYLYGMVTNLCLNRLRDSRRHLEVHEIIFASFPKCINPTPFSLDDLLQSLTVLQRKVVQLHDIEGYSCLEVAFMLGRTPAAVRKQLSLAHKTMKNYGKD